MFMSDDSNANPHVFFPLFYKVVRINLLGGNHPRHLLYVNIQDLYRERESNPHGPFGPRNFLTTIAFATKETLKFNLTNVFSHNGLPHCFFFVCGLGSVLTILKVIASIRKLVDYVLPQILLYWLCLLRQ